MQFHTELTPEKLPESLRLTDRIVTMGSCFADVMGRQLADHKLTVLANPFGTVFNAVSIGKLLTMAIDGGMPDEALYAERDGSWFHYDFHSSCWGSSREELRTKLTGLLDTTRQALLRADWLMITLGTAMVYRHTGTETVVANCHKMPASLFEKYLYAQDHLRDELQQVVRKLRRTNPNLRVLLTVSPVRHTRDTLPVNQVSKSMLRLICHELTVWEKAVYYFPAYEIMVDDLRDYRFYEADLIHPNGQAQEYIFEKFVQSAFDTELRTFVTEWDSIRKSLAHRPLHGPTKAHQAFLQQLLTKLERLQDRIDVTDELALVRSGLTDYKHVYV
ncbi:GSCFA domain-containing protein [Arsenicibacter rosenii]|uniref:GSCFA domain-containing protein n=1 Tax=Arsenicibacter rosenii TaxID=1750698 RepID=A0A1S2VE07_9BACT|nr:GSCFA domain-containing protein [Arsenicibacter rosenii]OIN56932.1 hypothetical protein BLX24_22475 [Arsenicibacter rosenii]